jgi:UDP-glucose 4-epimerase
MKLLITGGSGTLGKQIIQNYSKKFIEIHVLDNFATSSSDSLSEIKGVQVHEGSVSSISDVENVFGICKPTHVIHLAASYKDPNDWQEDILTNVLGMANVIRFSEKHKVEKFINVQTVLCYGRPAKIPISVDSPLNPESSYAITKVAAENLLRASSLSYASLRLGNVVAPGLSIGPIPNFYKNITAGEKSKATETIRDFLDIDDFMRALDIVIDGDSPSGVFNISSGKGVSMPEIYKIVEKLLDVDGVLEISETQKDDIPEIVLDPGETKRTLGWQATVPLEDSIKKCLESYKEHGIGNIYTHLKRG